MRTFEICCADPGADLWWLMRVAHLRNLGDIENSLRDCPDQLQE